MEAGQQNAGYLYSSITYTVLCTRISGNCRTTNSLLCSSYMDIVTYQKSLFSCGLWNVPWAGHKPAKSPAKWRNGTNLLGTRNLPYLNQSIASPLWDTYIKSSLLRVKMFVIIALFCLSQLQEMCFTDPGIQHALLDLGKCIFPAAHVIF